MRPLKLLCLFAVLLAIGWKADPARVGGSLVSVDTLIITPTADTLMLGGSDTVSARIADSLGRAVRNAITWVSRDTLVLKIRSAKQVGAKSIATLRATRDSGRTYLVASAGSLKDSILWVVRDTTCSETTVGSINLLPDSAVMRRLDKGGFVALVRNTCGNIMQNSKVVWSSTDSAKLTVAATPHAAGDSVSSTTASLDSSGTIYIRSVLGTVKDSSKVRLAAAP